MPATCPPAILYQVVVRRLLAVAESDIETRRITVVIVRVNAAVLLAVALVDDVLEPVPALLLSSELAVERDMSPAPAERGAVRPVAATAERLAGTLYTVVGLALAAAGLAVAGCGEGGGREGRESGGESGKGGELELHGDY